MPMVQNLFAIKLMNFIKAKKTQTYQSWDLVY